MTTSPKTNKKQPFSATSISRRRVVLLVALLLLIYVAAPQFGNFTEGFANFRHAQPVYLLLCVICTVTTYLLTAATYALMAKKDVALSEMIYVQAATALTNRLLPAGIGSMGLNAAFLQKRGHSLNQALSVVAANNTLGFIGHMLLLVLVLIISGGTIMGFEPHISMKAVYVAVAIIGFLIGNLIVFRNLRMRILRSAWSVLLGVLEYRDRPKRASLALACSMALTLLYAAALYVSSSALDIHISFAVTFLIFTVATFVGTITPTPGGLVGLEAALVAGFTAYGVDPGSALAIALLYRFITYWLPMIPGFFAFRYVQRQYL